MRSSRPLRSVAILGLVATLLLGGASPALADHCGGEAKVAPSSGPGGTVFVIRPQLGAATVLRLYRDDDLVLTVHLADPAVRYVFRSRSGDAGAWRVEARVKGHRECGSEAAFAVTGLPTTSTTVDAAIDRPATPLAAVALLILAGIAGGLGGWRRGRRPTS